jgi:ABC-type iron transport system FetAB permease component
MKYVIYVLLTLVYFYFCTWVFNHGQAWIGIGLAVAGIIFAAYNAEKLIKKQSATKE